MSKGAGAGRTGLRIRKGNQDPGSKSKLARVGDAQDGEPPLGSAGRAWRGGMCELAPLSEFGVHLWRLMQLSEQVWPSGCGQPLGGGCSD